MQFSEIIRGYKKYQKMVRKLKFHEKKLLKKVDFISWDIDNNIHEVKMMKKYYVQKREDYRKYIIPVYRSL